MRTRIWIAPLLAILVFPFCAVRVSVAQFTIATVAGGGPNNLPAQQASVGFAQSIALDKAGNLYIADSYSSQIFKVSTTGTLTLVAGNGTMGYSGDGGAATSAALNRPEGIFVDGSGNIFIADTDNSVIREVSNGQIQTVAGNFAAGPGYSGDGAAATSAQLNDPFGVFVDGQGNLFIADTDNNVIREVLASNGNIQTVAGNFSKGGGYSGNGGLATSAQLAEPEGISVDAFGNIFIADTLNSVIREVTGGTIQTVAGTYYAWADVCNYSGDGGLAVSAQLCLPNSIYVDSSSDVYIADTQNSIIREVSGGNIQLIAGTPDTTGYTGNGGAAIGAELNYPGGVAVDGAGDIFIADTKNYVVREVTAGNIQPFAGNNTLAYSGDGGPATSAALDAPGGVALDSAGNIYIADTNSSVIRVVNTGTQPVTIAGVTIQPGDVQTVAGNGQFCTVPIPGGCGDGGAATGAQLNFPYGVFVDSSGNIYIADTGLPATESSVIRMVNPAGTIQTVVGMLGSAGYAGDGGAPLNAQLDNPQGVFVDGSGDIFIADTGNSALRIATGSQSLTFAGTTIPANTIVTLAGQPPAACADTSTGCGDNGTATSASLNFPTGVAVDSAGNVYIADSQDSVIRVVNSSSQNPLTIAGTQILPGDIRTVAGTLGRFGYTGDNGAPTSALLNTPYDVFVDALGNIYIADSDNSSIREVVAVSGLIQTIAGNGSGTGGFSGDGGQATSAELNTPGSVFPGGSGIFLADTDNSRIRQMISTVAVAVVPSSSTLAPGGTQQYLATVSGTSNANVAWLVNGMIGGNSTAGRISPQGLYQAPSSAPSSAITVSAVSEADGFSSGSTPVSIAVAGVPAIGISTTPAGVTVVYTAASQSFTAAVTGETNTAVNWHVNSIAGGNSTVGTIDSNGNYNAPGTVPSQPVVIISAVSQADSTVSGSYPVTLVTAPAAQSPAPQTISPGGSATFSLTLNANTGSPHDPITLSCLPSSLPSGASCSFSPITITPGSSAVPFSLTVTVPSSAASLRPRQTLWPRSPLYLALTLLAGVLVPVGKRRKGHILWVGMIGLFLLAMVACGGGSSSPTTPPQTYTIKVQGTTPAQLTPVTITTVSLTVK